MSGVFLSREDLILLSPSTRAEIIALVSGQFLSGVYKKSEDGPANLSSLQAENLVHGLNEKPRSVLKSIIEGNDGEHGFWCKNVASKIDINVSELSGVWSVLTQRTCAVTDDFEAYLIGWEWNDERNDYYGKLHPMTYRNCKKAMNL